MEDLKQRFLNMGFPETEFNRITYVGFDELKSFIELLELARGGHNG